MLVIRDVSDDLLAVTGVSPQPLGTSSGVARDHRIRSGQNGLRGSVVLLEKNRRSVGVIAFELFDIANRGTAESVNALIGITDDAQLRRRYTIGALTDKLVD